MKISCKTITHGRPHLLEEALFSFLNQDWDGDAELVIVNDCPYQTLHFEHPKVRIENFKNIFPTIGEKENYTVEICTSDIIVTWDDDDIAMPWHFKNIKKYWQKDTN
ncbi:MAG: glycosyltransferase family A protein, partial [Candidatus Aenigmatarchaeota archaeon]